MTTFSAAKMRSRLAAEGRADSIDDKIEKILDRLDGKEAQLNLWKKTVEDKIEHFVRLDGVNYPVNIDDCIKE